MDARVEHNEDRSRFDLFVDGRRGGYLTYEINGGCLDIQHTVVSPELRGNKLGEVLVGAATEFAQSKGLSIVPSCSYAKKIMK